MDFVYSSFPSEKEEVEKISEKGIASFGTGACMGTGEQEIKQVKFSKGM